MAKYLRIADDLRDRIIDGSYEPGRRLPSNRELAQEYRTTLVTLRASLQLLADQGWVTVEHGNGTFVADVGVDADMLSSLDDQAGGSGARLETKVLGFEAPVVDQEASRLLEVGRPGQLGRLDRLRVVGGVPAVFQSSYVAGDHASTVSGYDGTQPLYRFLRTTLGMVPVHSRERVRAGTLPAPIAAELGVEPARPVVRSQRVTSSHEGRPMVFDDAFVLTDVLDLVIDRHGRTTSASLRPAGDGLVATGDPDAR